MKAKSKSTNNIDKVCEIVVHKELRVFFGYNLIKSGLILRSIMDSRNTEHFELSTPECGILYILNSGEATNQLALGSELGVDKATMVKVIDKLESHKLVKRVVDPKDRRSKNVILTPKGEKTLLEIKKLRTSLEKEIFSSFSKVEEEQLRALIPRLLESVMNIKK